MARPVGKALPLPMGTGLGLLRPKTIGWVLVTALALLAVDYGVSLCQRYTIEQRQKAKARLERVALFNLRADVADLITGPSGTFRLTIYLDNPFPEDPLFVMAPSIQAYVQVGTVWNEIPSRPASDQEGRVLKLAERQTFDYVFDPNTKEFEELIPGYMHMRVTNTMLVSQQSQPEEDLVERIDNYYLYLMPYIADDQEIFRKNSFPGKAPLWIPMGPH